VRAMARLHIAAMRGLVIDKLYWDEDDTSIDDAFELLVWYKGIVMRRLADPTFADEAPRRERPLRRRSHADGPDAQETSSSSYNHD
ncbi:MAG TPA: hypothetical protein VEC60_02495, partial [Reyranella sp.]|nr:hypothetical protein [Reyranella sp.]